MDRKSERELVVTRTVNGPARIVFEAWTKPELFERLVFRHDASTIEFFGRYLEVTPHSRLGWTNDEGDDGGAVATVTFEDQGGKTLLVVHDLYPTKEALDAAIASGATAGRPETLEQLDELLVTWA